MGTVGGSLRVQCRYEEKYKTFTKYWCRQPCLPLWNQTVATRGSEEEMRSGRVSIVDHPGDLTFTVTLENLTVDDTGKYRCGIATILHEEGLHGFLPDLFLQVQVFVSPSPGPDKSCGTRGLCGWCPHGELWAVHLYQDQGAHATLLCSQGCVSLLSNFLN
ncbi:protein CD300H-like isoform X1 [Callorhinus ursinus]